MHPWIYLSFAIAAEVGATTCLKLSNGFENSWYAIPIFILYGISFWLLALAIKEIELGIAYAVWAGVGTAIVALIGVAIFQESMTFIKVVSVLAIIGGVVGLHLADRLLAT